MRSLRAPIVGSLLLVTTAAAQTSTVSTTAPADATVPALKDPVVARLLGIIPGVGHIYAGEASAGFLYFSGTLGILGTGGYVAASAAFSDHNNARFAATVGWATVIATGGLWTWSIIDAGRAARRTNAKRARSTSLLVEPVRMPVAHGGQRTAVRLGIRIGTP
jgi:hypothetical protein